MLPPAHIHPHDLGLPAAIIRKRRRAHAVARWMLIIAGVTALAGWPLFGASVSSAVKSTTESPFRALIAYGLLIVSSVTLILGLWYLLLAQVSRIARIVDADALDPAAHTTRCPNCGWPHDSPDRFCRHCGKPLPAVHSSPSPAPPVATALLPEHPSTTSATT